MKIDTVQDFGKALRQGGYTTVGGYPLFFITADGGALAFGTAWEERAEIARAIIDNDTSGGWRVVAVDVNWEDADLRDDHDGGRIESAYAEDDATEEYIKIPESYSEWRRRSKGFRDAFPSLGGRS